MKKMVVVILVMLAQVAQADQCLVLTSSEAQKALEIIKKGQKFHEYCQLCNDKSIREFTVENAEIINTSWPGDKREEYRILIEGSYIQKYIDIAYIYVDGKNLGLSVNCGAGGVDPILPQN